MDYGLTTATATAAIAAGQRVLAHTPQAFSGRSLVLGGTHEAALVL